MFKDLYQQYKTLTRHDLCIISLITLIGFLTIGEICARIFKEPVSLYTPSENAKIVYELNTQHKDINAFGMRDKEWSENDIKNLYKIAVIGDSHAYSIRVGTIAETFPSVMEERLNHHLGKRLVKVLNFGVPGYNTAQELEVLRSKAVKFEPNLVVLQYCINDTHVCNYIQPAHKSINAFIHKSHFLARTWKNLLYSHFGKRFLFEWVGSHFPDALLAQEGLVGTRRAAADEVPAHQPHPARTPDRVPGRYHYMLGQENWRQHIQTFADVSKQKGVALLATGFIDAEEKAVFLHAGFDVYSFFEIFQGRDMQEYGYNPDNTASHFNANGCYFVGEYLANYIQNHYAIAKD